MKTTSLLVPFILYTLSSHSNHTNPSQDSLVLQTVDKFYNWYINVAYPKSTSYYQIPPFEKLDETTYIFDLREFKERINTIDYFSEDYKEKLVSKLESCNAEMRKINWEYEPEPMFNINACNYLWGNQWVGGQGEKITGYKIDRDEKNSEEYSVIVSILIEGKTFVRSHVFLTKKVDEFKINEIKLIRN
ncbi:hypothetical protein [Marivirga harenae]|uniref:hypothetical protein n=1 Tax=Marivirga harenae TaxID=2010992 RepID=UPI0026DF0971|nr:hypothetical protein [Marivirga harenae]WKV10936.1 hypothetical protein Q3Y49_12005 [Marivirga harenae]